MFKSLASLALLSLICGCQADEKKTQQSSDELEASCLKLGNIFDPKTLDCRPATERDCMERNQLMLGRFCIDSPHDSPGSADILGLKSHCTVNSFGALTECQDFQVSLPILPPPASDHSPAWLSEARIAAELSFHLTLDLWGKIDLRIKDTEGVEQSFDSTLMLFRNQEQGKPLTLVVKFAPGTIVQDQSRLEILQSIARLEDLGKVALEARNRALHTQWLSSETLRLRSGAPGTSSLYKEWSQMLRDDIPGTVVWDLTRDCPAEQLVRSDGAQWCKLGFIFSDADPVPSANTRQWQSKSFLKNCWLGKAGVTLASGNNEFAILDAGVFPSEAFSLKIAPDTRFVKECYIKALDLDL